MEKIVYLTFPGSGFDGAAYRDRLLSNVCPPLLGVRGLRALTVEVNDLLADMPRPMLLLGNGAALGAAVSVWMDNLDDRAAIEQALTAQGESLQGYLVTESVPQACTDRDWPDGARSPGVTHFTWFEKAPQISDEAFFHNWFNVHTPFSFELHPLRCEYIRNAVARALTADAPPVRAIVGERFAELRDYTDPQRLFGSPEVLAKSAAEAGDFSDPNALHSLPLSQYIIRSM